MTNFICKKTLSRKFQFILLTICTLYCTNNYFAQAQINPDNTLAGENSVVNQINGKLQHIEGGAIRGNNLFHSFSEFNINDGDSVLFINPSGIINILSRVTGNNSSQILGELGVLGDANLFLINPNGIFFGPNAQLNLNGSFIASTADSIILGGGSEFSATNPQSPPLLNITTPVGLQFEGILRNISTQAQLIGANNKTIALIGGQVSVEDGLIKSDDGRIVLASVEGDNFVNLQTDELGWLFDYQNVSNFNDINISQGAFLDVTSDKSGNIQIQGRNVTIKEASSIRAINFGSQADLNISISAFGELNLLNSEIFIESLRAKSGNILIKSQNLLVESGQIGLVTSGIGNGGDIELDVNDNIQLTGFIETSDSIRGGGLFTQTFATGNGGKIIINTSNLTVENGSSVETSTFGEGKAGDILINAANSISLKGSNIPSGISAQTGRDSFATGDAGNININTQHLNVLDGAKIVVVSRNDSQGGNLTVNASDSVLVSGTNSIATLTSGQSSISVSAEPALVDELGNVIITPGGSAGKLIIETNELIVEKGAKISSDTFGAGDAGELSLNLNKLKVIDGGLIISGSLVEENSPSLQRGDGGDLTINASESIKISGEGIVGENIPVKSSLITQAEGKGGNAGELTINTPQLTLSNEAILTASTFRDGNAADINITALQINILNGATISALTQGQGDGGNININTINNLVLGKDSNLIVETSDRGKAGNINIVSPLISIGENAQLSATATETSTGENAQAGSVSLQVDELNIQGILGIFAETRSEADAGSLFIQPNNNSSLIINFTDEGFISASTTASGDGGNIQISAPKQISIQGLGSITTSTSAQGNAGTINILTQKLSLSDGVKIAAFTSGGNDANTEIDSFGDGGDIFISVSNLNLENDAAITVESFGQGIGGDIEILADVISLNDSDITAETLSTDGGNIALSIQEALFLTNSSNITTTAGTAQAGGDGGDINIAAPFIVSNPSNPINNIIANAFEGDGGNINITTNTIFGGEFLTIDASSQLGLDGEVVINEPEIDPTKGLIIITANFVDVESLIAQNLCAIEDNELAQNSSFTILGKGGLPAQPTDFLKNNIILTPWLELNSDSMIQFNQSQENNYQFNLTKDNWIPKTCLKN